MSPSRRASGIGMMYAGGATTAVALLLVAFATDPFPIALILMAGGVLVFFAGAGLNDQRSSAHQQGDPPPGFWDGF